MRFRNKDDDAVRIPRLGINAAGAGAEDGSDAFDVDVDLADGIALQCGDDGRFEPVDDEAKALVAGAVADYSEWAQEYEASVAPDSPTDGTDPDDGSVAEAALADQTPAPAQDPPAQDPPPSGDDPSATTDDQQGSQS